MALLRRAADCCDKLALRALCNQLTTHPGHALSLPVRQMTRLVRGPHHMSLPPSRHIVTSARTFCPVGKLSIINVQDEEHFKTAVLESKTPVIVDFHANWCGPCKHLAPRLEKVMSESGKEIVLAKVDIDELGDLAMRYKVTAVPSVISMKNGKKVDQFVGLRDIDELQKFVKKLVD